MTEALLILTGIALLVSTAISVSQWFRLKKSYENQRIIFEEYHELVRSNERILNDLRQAVDELSKEDCNETAPEEHGSDEDIR